MQCAEILTDCIVNNRLCDYEKTWQSRFNKEIQIGLKMRKVYEKLSPEDLKELFSLMKQHKEVLEKYGDFENHSKIIYALVSDAQMRSFLGDLLLHVFRDLHI
jgi:flavin-dependent dehydrogenase